MKLKVRRPSSLRFGGLRISARPRTLVLGVNRILLVDTQDGQALKLFGSPNAEDWADPQYRDFLLEGSLRTKTHTITLYRFRDAYYARGQRPGSAQRGAIDLTYARFGNLSRCVRMAVVIYPVDPEELPPPTDKLED